METKISNKKTWLKRGLKKTHTHNRVGNHLSNCINHSFEKKISLTLSPLALNNSPSPIVQLLICSSFGREILVICCSFSHLTSTAQPKKNSDSGEVVCFKTSTCLPPVAVTQGGSCWGWHPCHCIAQVDGRRCILCAAQRHLFSPQN